ncbi:hypothetical protein Syun_030617 [Stephania yunnanensis]|uniref:Uncharacterized protein n=1 Tax=Stephania yunnanensis TaxID=152371 RepID=A0AAP0HC20_9MAGN
MDAHVANDNKISSPMPAIGLYMAVATLVCLILMLCDIFNAIRQKKPWIPCRFFVLNSFTLTLLSIATKLPSDLTTSMPSACDQLSKLCGTSLMCISIAFFMPSDVNMSRSEYSANLASLSIMAITIVVNVSLQISTGAIFLFKVEHIITLLLMLLLLGVTGGSRMTYYDYFTLPIRKSLQHMPRNVYTLKRCYIHSYITDPQLALCRFSSSATVGVLCTICFAVLSETAIRAYSLDKGLKGDSDYKWSIWVVVGLQMITLLVGALSIVCRCLALASQMHCLLLIGLKRLTFLESHNVFLLTHRNWNLYLKTLNHSRMVFQIFRTMENILDSSLFLTRIWVESVNKLTLVAIRIARDFFALTIEKAGIVDGLRLSKGRGVIDDLNDDDKIILKLKKEFDDDGLDKYMSQIPNFYSEFLLRKGFMDMEMCIKKHSTYPMHSLLDFLGKETHDDSMKLLKQISKSSDKLLLLVCLVRMADSLAPSLRIVSLASALDQAFEIIVFIHEKTHAINASKAMKVNLANDIWRNKHIRNHWFQTYIIKHLKSGGCSCHILDRVAELDDKYLSNFFIQELHDIINIVGDPRVDAIRSTNGSIEELYDRIERLFVELLHSFFDQFPDAIFNSLNESVRAFEFQENVKTSMELVARFKDVDPLHYANHNIGSFMTTDSPVEENEAVAGHAVSLGNVVIADGNNVTKAGGTHVAQIETI